MSDRITDLVDKAILESTRGHERPKIHLTPKEFKQFLEEITPTYQNLYGGLITDPEVTKEGYTNVVYRGCRVVLTLQGEK